MSEREADHRRKGIPFEKLREGRCKFPLGTITARVVLRRTRAHRGGLLRTVSGESL